MKVILFILSLQLVVQRPFLIISTSTALPAWEAVFLQLAPCASIIYYKGNREVRSSIRSLEFYNEGGRIMFNVLLSTADVAVEVPLFCIYLFECLQIKKAQVENRKIIFFG